MIHIRQTGYNRFFFEFLLINVYLALLGVKVMGVYTATDRIRFFAVGALLFFLVIESLSYVLRNRSVHKLWGSIILYMLYLICRLYIGGKMTGEDLLSYLFMPAMVLLFFESYINNQRKIVYSKIISWQFVFQCILFVAFFSSHVLRYSTSRTTINTVYYIVLMLPITICSEKKPIRIAALAMCATASIISLKLGACIVTFFVIIIFYFYRGDRKKENVFRMLRYLLIVGIIFVMLSIVIRYGFKYDIYEKILSASNTGGSGRIELWHNTWSNIIRSPLSKIVFGHLTSSSTENYLAHSAHNDYLEMIWRIGFLGLTIFLPIIVNLISIAKIPTGNEAKMAKGVLISGIFSLLFVMLISQLVFVPSYSGYLAICIGSMSSTIIHGMNNE